MEGIQILYEYSSQIGVKKVDMTSIAIIGLGFVGTSLALALKKASPGANISGFDLRRDYATRARQRGSVDSIHFRLQEAVSGVEVVFLSGTAGAVQDFMEHLCSCLPASCIVTDTATTKERVMQAAERILGPRVNFIGGNPFIEGSVPDHEEPDPEAFVGKTYCLVPTVSADPGAVEKMIHLVKIIGARPLIIDPAEHDACMAGFDLLPFFSSCALAAVTARSPFRNQLPGLRASVFPANAHQRPVDAQSKLEALLTSRESIARWLETYIHELHLYRNLMDLDDDAIRHGLKEGCQLLEGFFSPKPAEKDSLKTPDLWEQTGAMLVGHTLTRKIRAFFKLRQRDRFNHPRRRERKDDVVQSGKTNVKIKT
jgi:prephenate dehydrogenase